MSAYDPMVDPRSTPGVSSPKEDQTIYCVRGTESDRASHKRTKWFYVTKQDFVRYDGPTITGVKFEILTQIATYEDVPACCLQTVTGGKFEGKDYHWNESGIVVTMARLEQLEGMLDYVKRVGTKVNVYIYQTGYGHSDDGEDPESISVRCVSKFLNGRDIQSAGYRNVIIDRKWILAHGDLWYDPVEAEKRLTDRVIEIKEKARRLAGLPPDQRPLKGTKPQRHALDGLFSYMQDQVHQLKPYFDGIPEKNSWRGNAIFMKNYPSTSYGSMWATVMMTKVYVKLAGKRSYRSSKWTALLADFIKDQHKRIPPGDFLKFIKKEAEAAKIRFPKPDPEKKKKRGCKAPAVLAVAGVNAGKNPEGRL